MARLAYEDGKNNVITTLAVVIFRVNAGPAEAGTPAGQEK